MPYQLKKNQPGFDVVDGPFAGQKYRHNEVYTEVPPGEKERFEVAKKAVKSAPQGGVATKKKGGSEANKPTAVKSKGGTRR